ncbi:MAG: radical SAM protein, partial [archaeon]
MKVGGYLEMSTVDYPNKLCSVLFLFGCNLRCKFCFNWPLVIGNQFKEIPLNEIVGRFMKYREFVNAITISGGEPCFQDEELKELIKLLKEKKFQVKLDT